MKPVVFVNKIVQEKLVNKKIVTMSYPMGDEYEEQNS